MLFAAVASAQQNQTTALATRPSPAALPEKTEGCIHLDVVVTDKSGKPVSGLGLSDFTLLDDGRPAKILSFKAFDGTVEKAEPPAEIMLFIDAANTGIQDVNVARDQVKKFLLQNGGHLEQPVSLFELTDEGLAILSPPSLAGNALAAKAGQINFELHRIHNGGAWEAVQKLDLSIRALTAVAQSEARKPNRKLLLWFGSGWATFDSSRPPAASRTQQQQWFKQIVQLSTLLRDSRISIYS